MERCETCGCTLYHYHGFYVAADGRFLCEQCGAEEDRAADPEPERTPNAADLVEAMGLVIEAPGFTPETFTAAVERAQARATMPIIPAGHGVVLVESARSGERYHVTRETCSCPGHHSHGHCIHRAAAIFASDFYGVDLCHEHVLGCDANGEPVTVAYRAAQLEEHAA